ncbi:MAG: prefoldin subunit alpha [Promethearchaeota archaeon]|nr:MAG: prefoldin subunit alpha [Candidatus Lokiarchaeota archaeon]
MEPARNVQELIYRYRYLKDQRDFFAEQLELLNASLSNIINTKNTLNNLKNTKVGEEILIPVGGLANIKATIRDPEKIILNISQDIAIQKNVDDSIEFLDKIIEQHNDQINYLRNQIQSMDANLQVMSKEFQKNMPNQ